MAESLDAGDAPWGLAREREGPLVILWSANKKLQEFLSGDKVGNRRRRQFTTSLA